MKERTEIEVLLEAGATIATDEDMHSRGTDRKIEPDCPSLRKTYEEATNTPDKYESMDGGGYAPSKGAGAKIQSGYKPQNTPDTEDGVCNDDCRYTDGLCDRHGTGNTPDTEWEWVSEDKWHQTWRHKEHGERQINTELLNYILSSRDTYWKERVRKEVKEAVDECVKIVNNKVRWAKDADPDEVYEELWAVAGIKGVCEACGERHITNEDNLK